MLVLVSVDKDPITETESTTEVTVLCMSEDRKEVEDLVEEKVNNWMEDQDNFNVSYEGNETVITDLNGKIMEYFTIVEYK